MTRVDFKKSYVIIVCDQRKKTFVKTLYQHRHPGESCIVIVTVTASLSLSQRKFADFADSSVLPIAKLCNWL